MEVVFPVLVLLGIAALVFYGRRRSLLSPNVLKRRRAFISEGDNDDKRFRDGLVPDIQRARGDFLFTAAAWKPEIWTHNEVMDALKNASERGVRIEGIIAQDEKLRTHQELQELVKEGVVLLRKLRYKDDRGLNKPMEERFDFVWTDILERGDSTYYEHHFRVSDDNVHVHFHLSSPKQHVEERACARADRNPKASLEFRQYFDFLKAHSDPITIDRGLG